MHLIDDMNEIDDVLNTSHDVDTRLVQSLQLRSGRKFASLSSWNTQYNEGIESFEIEVIEPEQGAPEIGVIDSGIMEGNKYISSAIISEKVFSPKCS